VQLGPVLSHQPASRQRPLRCSAEGSRSRRRGAMPSSSGAERCLLAPRNINDGNGDDELTCRSAATDLDHLDPTYGCQHCTYATTRIIASSCAAVQRIRTRPESKRPAPRQLRSNPCPKSACHAHLATRLADSCCSGDSTPQQAASRYSGTARNNERGNQSA
jgi:hypothetical protein